MSPGLANPTFRSWSAASAVVALLFLLAAALGARAEDTEGAQSGSLLDPGQVVITGFSGTLVADSQKDVADAEKVDETFINPDGAVARIVDVSGVPAGTSTPGAEPAEAYSTTARQIGQVFGIAIDEAVNSETERPAPNIYLGASSAYGLHIVVPDRDGDGWPKRVETGDPEAEWMEGLFGTAAGGGPGSIWKIDGVTGEVSLFADITDRGEANSGPGLGNLTFDRERQLIYASDLDTGMIVSLDLDGNPLGVYDHGVDGRAAADLPAVEDDAEDRADIKSPQFKSSDPTTWGYTLPPRRVWGLKVHDGRLYYAVAEGPEIWSVGFTTDGEFDPQSARREIALPTDAEPYEVADISFTHDGIMILAQRPPVTGGYDYVTAVASGPARVLRYQPASDGSGAWEPVPEEYAVGLRADYRNTSGGVALGYGYKEDGGLDYGRCEAMLWTTGEGLLVESGKQIKVERVPGFAASAIDGIQGTDIDLIRPDNVPPEKARFVDYDGDFVDYGQRGHLGDIEIPYTCAGGDEPVWEPEYQVNWWDANYDGEAPEDSALDLAVTKTAPGSCRAGGICRFEVTVENRGDEVYYGPLLIGDTLSGGALTLVSTGPAPWGCSQSGSYVSCHRPPVYLKPGRSLTLSLSFRLSSSWSKPTLGNCAAIGWLASDNEKDTIRAVQNELARRGYYAGTADGIFGPQSADAVLNYQQDAGLDPSGEVDRELIISLFGKGAYRPGDADPGNDEGCAEHTVEEPYAAAADYVIYEPKPDAAPYIPPVFYPKPIRCEPGFARRGDSCVRICPPGTYFERGRCYYDEPEEIVCRGGRIPTPDGECICPPGTREQFTGVRTRCVVPERKICYGGYMEGGDCTCRPGYVPVSMGRRSWLCTRIVEKECIFGTWRGNSCVCPLNRYLVQIDRNRYECVRRQGGGPICIGGVSNNGRCYCPNDKDPRRIGANIFQCVGNDPIRCLGGYFQHGRCQCSDYDERPVRIGYNTYQCRGGRGGGGHGVICLDGKSRGGECLCGRGQRAERVREGVYKCVGGGGDGGHYTCPNGARPVKASNGKWRCPKPDKIVCSGGSVKGDRCVCPNGRPYQVGVRQYRCVKDSDRQITCQGGSVAGNRCVCAKGLKVVGIGRNAYRCVRGSDPGGDETGGGSAGIVCSGGKVQGRTCVCGANFRAVRIGNNRYNCIRRADGGGGTTGGDTTGGGRKVVCVGGKVDGRNCVCGSNEKRVAFGRDKYRCVKTGGGSTGGGSTGGGDTAKVTCSGGKVVGTRCVCGSNFRAVPIGRNKYRCVKGADSGSDQTGGGSTPKVVCSGGKVVGNSCVCGSGLRMVPTGRNKYRCVKQSGGSSGGQTGGGSTKPKITCSGGKVQGGSCVCGSNFRAVPIGNNKYRCVRRADGGADQTGGSGKKTAPARVVCAGGKVSGNSCVCGSGKRAVPIGTNRYRCVAAQTGGSAGQVKKKAADQREKKKAADQARKKAADQAKKKGGSQAGGCPAGKFPFQGKCLTKQQIQQRLQRVKKPTSQ
ncbi:MAG: peptidoglycan-binding domain-containing protein [Hyphomicrobiaceae bacterium]